MMVHSQSLSALQKRAATLEKQMKSVIKTTDNVKKDTSKLQDETEILKDQTDALDDEVGTIGDTTNEIKKDVDGLKRTLVQAIRGDIGDEIGVGTSWSGTNNIFGNTGFRTETVTITFKPSETEKDSGTFTTSPHLFWRGDVDAAGTWTGSYTVISDMVYFYNIPSPDGGSFWSGVAQGSVEGDIITLSGRIGTHQTVRFQLQVSN